MSVLALATIGGLVSFISTSIGSVLYLSTYRMARFSKFKISIDFALGVMLSAVAFSLVGPVAIQSFNQSHLFLTHFIGFALGGVAIYGLKLFIDHRENQKSAVRSSQLLLALALLVHNFPEGLASGAALAGLDLQTALPILSSISLQNVPEGLLMVVALKSMGWSSRNALLGGFGSGVIELFGGILSGFTLQYSAAALPFLLMLAGGAMFTSVMIELMQKPNFKKVFFKPEFAVGILTIPILNSILN